MFLLSSLLGFVGLFVWIRYCPSFTLIYPERTMTAEPKKRTQKLITPLLVIAVIGILMQGILRDGVTTYMPSFISETYHLSNEISILTGVLLPVFSLVCTKMAARLHLKHIPNLLVCAALFFSIGTGAAVLLYFYYQSAPILSVVLLVVINACMHGINLMLISYLPAKLADREHLSTMAGLTNSFAYVGSAVSTYLIPMAAETAGWSATLFIWAAASVIGTAVCVLGIPFYRSKMKKSAV